MPVAQLVVNWFPNRIAKIEVPIVRFDVDRSIKRGPLLSLVIQNAGMVDAVEQFLILGTFDVDDEAKFNADLCRYFGGELSDSRQFLRIGVPILIDAVAVDTNGWFFPGHSLAVVPSLF